jgi:hypothetical protein
MRANTGRCANRFKNCSPEVGRLAPSCYTSVSPLCIIAKLRSGTPVISWLVREIQNLPTETELGTVNFLVDGCSLHENLEIHYNTH